MKSNKKPSKAVEHLMMLREKHGDKYVETILAAFAALDKDVRAERTKKA
jgi:hypothetical protein